MIFNFFKKKKKITSDPIEIISRIESGQLKSPKVSDNIIKLSQEEFRNYSDKHHENFKFTETLKDKYPTLIGKIEGYHPYAKDLGSSLMAVVVWPVYKKVERTFVVDCTLLAKTSGGTLTYPGEGTWIFFRELGEQKDTDGILRTYGIAETIFSEQLIQLALKEYKKKVGINNDL